MFLLQLSDKPNSLDDINPVTNVDLARVKKMALGKGSTTTPSPSQNANDLLRRNCTRRLR